MKTKRCSNCGKTKSTSEFYHKVSAPSGISSWCKVCELIAKREHHKRTYKPHPQSPVIANGKKRCSKCRVWKSFEKFSSHRRGAGVYKQLVERVRIF